VKEGNDPAVFSRRNDQNRAESRTRQGQVEKTAIEVRPEYGPDCYLCPGTERAGEVRRPDYEGPRISEGLRGLDAVR
jgi:galactose-1-phosphate uridylyltransferase